MLILGGKSPCQLPAAILGESVCSGNDWAVGANIQGWLPLKSQAGVRVADLESQRIEMTSKFLHGGNSDWPRVGTQAIFVKYMNGLKKTNKQT